MPIAPDRAVHLFRRRVAFGSFVGGALHGVAFTALGGGAALLAARFAGCAWPPSPWWAFAALPVLAAGFWRMRRDTLTPAAAAAHLDRRLSLHGLLLAARDGGPLDASFAAALSNGLERTPQVLPALRWRALLPLPLAALAFAAVVGMLPPPPVPPGAPGSLPAIAAELERLAAAERDLFARAPVPEDVKKELQQQLAELQQATARGEVPEWRDLDELAQRLEREQLLAAAREPGQQAGRQGAEAAAGQRAATAVGLASAAQKLAAAGVLDKLPEATKATLQAAQRPDGSIDPAALPQDAAALQALAEALAGAAGQAAQSGTATPGAAPGDLADLQKVLEQFGHGQSPGAGAGQGPGQGEDGGGDQGGRGGIDRGPGHSALHLTEDAQGGAGAVLPLPPGRALPGDWVPLGESRTEPQVGPVTERGAGGAAAAGAGGASWQLDLPPRQREVLRRFFGAGGGGTTNGEGRK